MFLKIMLAIKTNIKFKTHITDSSLRFYQTIHTLIQKCYNKWDL